MVQNKTLNLITYGCQMNKYDSETIAGRLKDYSLTHHPKEANLIIINTCAVRQHAEDKVYSLLGRLFKLKGNNPNLKIGMCGCLAEQYGDKLLKKFPLLDFVVGPANIYKLPEVVAKLDEGEKSVLTGYPAKGVMTLSAKRSDWIKAYVPIVLGCNNECAYCVVPYTRGNIRSRKPQEIVDEIKNLVELGYQEITLLGQNVNDYGSDFKNQKCDFLKLLESINEIKGLNRLRFITSHPKNFTHELINTLPQLKKVCEHIHLPIQSGSDKILKSMNRGYTVEFYQQLIDALRQKIPKVSITTDIIVGFPGEKESDFEQTLKAVQEIRFDAAFTFKFSPRPNTLSADYPNQIPEDVKQQRLEKLIEITSKISQEKNQQLIGEREEILIEGRNPKDPFFLMGRTKTDKLVFLKTDNNCLIGKLVNVKIISASTFSLKAELVDEERSEVTEY